MQVATTAAKTKGESKMKMKVYKAVMAKLDCCGEVIRTFNLWYTQEHVDDLRKANSYYANCSDEHIVECNAAFIAADDDLTDGCKHCLRVETVFEDVAC